MQQKLPTLVVIAGVIMLGAPLGAQDVPETLREAVKLAPTLEGVVGAEAVQTSPNSRFVWLYGGPECTDKDGGTELFKRLQTKARSEGLDVTLFSRECYRILVLRRHEAPEGVQQILTLGLTHAAKGDEAAELQQVADIAEAQESVGDSEIWDSGGAGKVLALRRGGECGDTAGEAALREALMAEAELAGLDISLFPRACYLVLVPPPGPQMLGPGQLWIGSSLLGVWESDSQ
jgi:hypothetical protein